MLKFSAGAAITFCLLAAGCGGPEVTARMSLPAEVQMQAQMACQAESGINIPKAVQVNKISATQTQVFTLNGPGITVQQAKQINQCARARLNAHMAGQPVGISQPAASATVAPAPARHAAPATSVYGCIPGGGVMQRGTLMCFDK